MAKTRRFRAEIETGHKGEAVIVPFDPAKAWGTKSRRVPGYAVGWLAKGTIAGVPFESFVGHRWGRFFILVPAEMQRAAGVKPGDVVDVVVSPRGPRAATGRSGAQGRSPRLPP